MIIVCSASTRHAFLDVCDHCVQCKHATCVLGCLTVIIVCSASMRHAFLDVCDHCVQCKHATCVPGCLTVIIVCSASMRHAFLDVCDHCVQCEHATCVPGCLTVITAVRARDMRSWMRSATCACVSCGVVRAWPRCAQAWRACCQYNCCQC